MTRDNINYIFIDVNGIEHDKDNKLSNYIIRNLSEYDPTHIKSYEADQLPEKEKKKADYMNINDLLEKINISE